MDFFAVNADVMDRRRGAKAGVGVIVDVALGDARGGKIAIEDELVMDMERRVGVAVSVFGGRPAANVIFAFVAVMENNVELKVES